jgi:hypothetical protein
MKIILLVTLSLLTTFAYSANAAHYTRGHIRKNGTYVAPSFKTNPNKSIRDNYSTKGNVNPYTGKAGKVNPNKI